MYSQGAACNQTRLREFVRGFTRAIPEGKLLVLDLIADSPGKALWRYPDSDTLGRFTQNASLIWCALNNWVSQSVLGLSLSADICRPQIYPHDLSLIYDSACGFTLCVCVAVNPNSTNREARCT